MGKTSMNVKGVPEKNPFVILKTGHWFLEGDWQGL